MFLMLIPALAICEPTIPPNKLFAVVNRGQVSLAVGKFDPSKGWIPITAFYDPLQPQDPLTIYGMKGKLGEVRITARRRPLPSDTFADWYPTISTWDWTDQSYALAIAGKEPDIPDLAQPLPLNNPEAEAAASDYLKSKGLRVSSPYLTQVFEADFGGTLGKGLLLCAHSDASALQDDVASPIYAVALAVVRQEGKDKTFALASRTSYKPASQTIQKHKEFYGSRPFYRFVAFMDLNGDGRPEMVLYEAQSDATTIDIYLWKGKTPARVLSAYKPILY